MIIIDRCQHNSVRIYIRAKANKKNRRKSCQLNLTLLVLTYPYKTSLKNIHKNIPQKEQNITNHQISKFKTRKNNPLHLRTFKLKLKKIRKFRVHLRENNLTNSNTIKTRIWTQNQSKLSIL
jgi:hypothetical protein